MSKAFKHIHVVFEGDSQVMQACISKMGGNQRNYAIVKNIWEAAFELDLGLEMQWRPREEGNQRLADSLEKQQDSGDWVASPEILLAVYRHPAVGSRPFNLELLLSFYSKWQCKGTRGVDAFRHPWAIVGDQWSILRDGQDLKKIKEERCDAAVLHPVSSSYWAAMLHSLPVKATLPVCTAQITAGYRLPDSKKSLNFTKLLVSVILW